MLKFDTFLIWMQFEEYAECAQKFKISFNRYRRAVGLLQSDTILGL